VLEKIAQGDGVTVYFIKYTEDGEEETVSADNIRQAASSSSDISTVSEVDGNVTATGVISEGSQPPLVGKYSGTEYKPKLSIGDDGSFVPEVYEGE
jgi:GTPase